MEQKKTNDSRKGTEIVINSGRQLTIDTIGDFIMKVREAMAGNETVIVEFDPDLEVDITALQLFCSACKTATAAGKKFIHQGPTPQTLIDLSAAVGIHNKRACQNGDTSCFHLFGGA